MSTASSRLNRRSRRRNFSARRPRGEQLERRLLLSAESEAFIRSAYVDLLDRPAEPAGLVYWSGLVDSGSSHAQVTLGIQASGEYRSRQVQEAFDDILHRLPETTTVDFYAQLLAEGGTPDQVRAILIGSQEYFQGQGNSDAAFLNSLFLVALDRPIEPAAQTFFGDLLATGASRTQVALIVLASPESDHLQVAGWYQQYLGRSPTANGLDFMAGLLQSGQREQQVIAIIVGSEEYALLAANRPPDGPVNIAVTTDPGVQQMPSIAVDPLDSQHLVVAYLDYSLPTADAGLPGEGYAGIGTAVSHDGGQNWQLSAIPLPEPFNEGAANPIARFDDQGHVFVTFMAATFLGPRPHLTNMDIFNPKRNASDREFGFQAHNGIFVARSDDGGLTWNDPATVVSHRFDGHAEVNFEIIPDIGIDTFSVLPDGQPNPNYGYVYVVWSRLYVPGQFPGHPEIDGGIDIMIAVSRDNGQTWETQLQEKIDDQGEPFLATVIEDALNTVGLPGLGIVDQPHIVIGPAGEIYVSNAGCGDFTVHLSRDGGATFDEPDHVSGRRIAFETGCTTRTNITPLPNNQFRKNVVRAIAVDPTRPGRVYAAENVEVFDSHGNLIDGADVIFARSDDQGETWQEFTVGPDSALNDDNDGRKPTGVPEDVTAGQVMARLAVDAQGNIGVIWVDTRRDPADHLLDVFGTVSTDGGQTFSPNFRITDLSFDADQGRFTNALGNDEFYIGDFIGLAMANKTAYAAWTDTRNGNQDIVVARFAIAPPPVPLNDRFEPNDTPELTPTFLGTIVQRFLPKLSISPGDEDWFHLAAFATGDLTVMALQSELGDNLRVELWNETATARLAVGDDLVDGSGQVTGERLLLPASARQEFLVRVVPEGDVETRYSLDLQALTADLGTRVHGVADGSLDPGDVALYLLAVGASGSLEVELMSQANVQGDFNLELLDVDDLSVIASGQSSGQPGPGETEKARLAVRKGEAVLVHVFGSPGSQGDFTLEFTNFDQFSTPETNTLFLLAGAGSSQAALGDLNGDGKLDVVVTDVPSDTVSVLLRNGDGTFQAPRQFVIGAFVEPPKGDLTTLLPTFGRDVTIADFDQDGIPDVAVTNRGSADVSVLLGRGDGTFEPQRRFDATSSPIALEAGDLDGDGLLDLAVVSSGTPRRTFVVATLLGRGDGTFRPQRTIEVPTGGELFNLGAIQIGELNGDGIADLVISGSGNPEVAVLIGNGDGTFTLQGRFPAARLSVGLAVADINGDGNLDILNTGFDHRNQVSVLLANGDGTFQPPREFFAGQNPVALEVADFGSQVQLADGSTVLGPPDGHPDAVVAVSGVLVSSVQAEGPPGVFVLPALFDDQGEFVGLGSPIQLAVGERPQDIDVGHMNVNDDDNDALDVIVVDRDGLLVIYGKPPNILPNNTRQTARDLGTVVHVVQPTLTITPQNGDDFYRMTVPDEAAAGAGDEVLDFSALFEAQEGPGLAMEVRNAAGDLLGSGERFRVRARQEEELTVHVFGVADGQGNRGAGAYTLVIDVLPQVVSVEAHALLPGVNDQPGGPTSSLVITLQGDRLDTATAQDPANYRVTFLGPDRLAGTPDDQVIPLAPAGPDSQPVVYNPGANVDVASGITFPTAVRQTVTLLFADPLPAGSYLIELSPDIQTEAFNAEEAGLLAGGAEFGGHPLVQFRDGQLVNGSRQLAVDLVLAAGALGDFSIWETGTPFLTNLHDDLAGLLDSLLTQKGDDPGITAALIDQVLQRFDPALGEPGQRPTDLLVLWLDPVSIDLIDPEGDTVDYDLEDGTLTSTIDGGYVNVGGNVEVVVVPVTTSGTFSLAVSNVPSTARGGAVQLTQTGTLPTSLTNDLRGGTTSFSFTF